MPAVEPIGSPRTRLIVIRGNSGSGKTSIARQLQLRHGRGCALVEQDYVRRIVLRERDKPGGVAPALIGHTVRFILDQGYHVVLEGILYSRKYGEMIRSLGRSHRGRTTYFYLDVSLEETLRRHEMRPQAAEFSADAMRGWYAPGDVLNVRGEHVIAETSSMEQTISFIAVTADLPLTMCDQDFRPVAR